MEQISISSDAFKDSTSLPVELTCDGEDRSPALTWDTIPAGTQSISLIVDDPDAPGQTWVHWIIYNMPADSTGLPAAVPKNKTLPAAGQAPQVFLQGICPGYHTRPNERRHHIPA